MGQRYIITLTASNRVGILAAVSNAMAELGGTLLEVKQTLLSGFFTMIVAVEFPEHRDRQVIVDHLHGICGPFGIELSLHDPQEGAAGLAQQQGLESTRRIFLTLTGRDKPGLLSRIASRLARDGIDITEMYATQTDERRRFQIVMQLAVPREVSDRQLHADLEELGRDVGLAARLEDERTFFAAGDLSLRWRP